MNATSPLFDLTRIARNRKRAVTYFANHDFLHHQVWQELMDRRAMINRPLANALVRGDLLPKPDDIRDQDWRHQEFGTDPGSDLDLLISFLELHLIDNLPAELARCRAALRPDGVFLACLFGGSTLTELRHSLLAAESEVTGGATARVAPFVSVRTLGGLVQKAGFALPVIDVDTRIVRYSSLSALLADIRGMGEGNPLAGTLRPLSKRLLAKTEACYRQSFSDENGRLLARFDLLHICGWSPHKDQQKPLKPGSGQMFLGDALKKSEGLL